MSCPFLIWRRADNRPAPICVSSGILHKNFVRFLCILPIVFIPKYRKKILYGRVKNDVREIISTLCKYKDVDIIAGAVCVDHIHLSVAIPPKISISNFMGYLKGKSTLMLYDRHPELQSKWDKAFWARGYYVETIE